MTDPIHPPHSALSSHQGEATEHLVDSATAAALKAAANDYPDWALTPRQVSDLELLLNGGFAPLTGFLGQADYHRVLTEMRLTDGSPWPIPINLDVSADFADRIALGGQVALRDPEGVLLAVLTVSDLWTPDRAAEAAAVFGTQDVGHPDVDWLLHRSHPVYLGGSLQGIQLPTHYDYKSLRDTPRQLRERLRRLGWGKVLAYQPKGPMHRAEQAMTTRAVQQVEVNLLIHPAVGLARLGQREHFTRIRCYEQVLGEYPEQTTALSLLPLAPRQAGPRAALWHAIVHRNHGCSHFLVDLGHADPGDDQGQPRYAAETTLSLLTQYAKEIGIEPVAIPDMVYAQARAQFVPVTELATDEAVLRLGEAEVKRRLQEGLEIPDWYAFPKVVAELRQAQPPRHRQGLTVFFTGLSGSGKSTIANALMVKLMEIGNRPVTLLDGDLVRKHLSSELGFSRDHRNINIRRIGYVASEITKNGGIAICAPIAPYAAIRREVREMIGAYGGFIEVHVATPLAICEARDRKGLYAKARAGLIKEFTGISDPYEAPEAPDIRLDTTDCTPDEAAHRVLLKLEGMGFIKKGG